MAEIDRLIDAFGELLYALAMADGKVQEEEVQTLGKVLQGHPWASGIKWSFNYEQKKQHSLEEAYEKALDTFKSHGPAAEYQHLLELMDAVAEAFGGTEESEQAVIDNFKQELKAKFLKDLDQYNLNP